MAAPQASSRLEMLQARFQQKQLQEKEQKLLQLYDQQQQRAYQVVQRGSAGSNGSNHGTTTSHQTVTRTTSTSHTTSTTHGGKVRQMFDERRQTSVKGIDRSYPLEPLDNKPRKQTTSVGGVATVNRQSVTVKRVARADANSSVNDGKPVVSYHEEITRESYGPGARRRDDEAREDDREEEFGGENHPARYANGNLRDSARNGVRIEEVFDEDAIERNRLMAKIHLMGFDESLKHRVRNDLESEQFPDELMVDVPDKLPRRPVAKKLSQAEARLERFKNANAKRNAASKGGNQPIVPKRRSEPMFPARSNPRVAKSPSPDPAAAKATETSARATARRSVPSSPSKSPDIVARLFVQRASEAKQQESRSFRRASLTKSTDGIGGKRTAKGTDAGDGGLDRNGTSSRDDAALTSHEDDAPIEKKSDAFVVDFDEREPKENDATRSRKPTLRKQLVDRQQVSSVTTARRPSSVSSASSGCSAQGQANDARSRMATRAKTPMSGQQTPRGASTAKSGATGALVDNLVSCKVCGRRFAQERVVLHEEICAKTVQKKRKQFDTMMYRVRGTELEPFVKKGVAKKQPESKPKKAEVKSNWRRKHEDFINAIRSAKQVTAHLAAGGKLSDLPPPPASDTSDYVQCPHCGRKFNQAAAERHIPKCEHMLHNKPAHARAPPKPRR